MRLSGSSRMAAEEVESLAAGSSCAVDGDVSDTTDGTEVETTGGGGGACEVVEVRAAARSALAFAFTRRLSDFSV